MKEHEQIITTLKQLAQTNSGDLDTADETSRAALAVWRVFETRDEIILSENFSDETVERLDQLAKAATNSKAEASAQDAASRFQSGVFDPDEKEHEATNPTDESSS